MPPPPPLALAASLLRIRYAVSRTSPFKFTPRRFYSPPPAAVGTSARRKPLLQQLQERGLVEAVTGPDGALEELIESGPLTAYTGIDSTSSSLHVGHLLPLMNLLHFYLNGHHAIALIGKSTASVGDPSGRDSERDPLAPDGLQHSFDSLWRQMGRFFEKGTEYALLRGYTTPERLGRRELVTNGDWLDGLGFVDFLRGVGRHVRVSQMLARESVKARMSTGQGINFAEFTYQLLQSYDFYHLHVHKNCRLQIGGSDQFGNITAGIDLIHKLLTPSTPTPTQPAPHTATYGLTTPLLTTTTGQKLSKSTNASIWLDPTRTPPFQLYQFFARLPDSDVGRYLKTLTLLPLPTVAAALSGHAAAPEKRAAQHLLAREVVALVHGEAKAELAAVQTRMLFPAPGERARFTAAEIVAGFAAQVVEVASGEVVGEAVAKVLRVAGVVKTGGEAVRLLQGGGVYVGLEGRKVEDVKARVESEWLVDGEVLVLRVGKGRFVIVKTV